MKPLVEETYKKGLKAEKEGRLEEAYTLFKKAVEVSPSNPEFWLSYLDVLIRLGRIAEAQRILDRLTRNGAKGERLDQIRQRISLSEPSLTQIQDLINLRSQKEYEEALNQIEDLLKKFPSSARLNNIQGILRADIKQFDGAMNSFERALNIKPDYAQAYNNMGNALKDEGKFEAARDSYNKAININPDYFEAHINLGNTLHKMGKFDDAIKSYKKANEIKSDSIEPYLYIGITSYANCQPEVAIENYREVIRSKPEHLAANFNLSVIFLDLGRLEEAEISFGKVIALKPDYFEALVNLGVIFKRKGKLEDAEAAFRKAVNVNPSSAEVYYNLGIVQKDLGRLEEAEESYIHSIKLKPNYREAHNNVGIIQEELGKLEDAEKSYDKAIELKADYGEALINRGQLLFNKGESELALQDFDLCNTGDSRSRALAALYQLGRIEEIYTRIDSHNDIDSENLNIAAFASFISEREKKDTNHNFCKNPLEFIQKVNIASYFEDPNVFFSDLIGELDNIKTVWEPYNKSTRNGYQSRDNLFENPAEKTSRLRGLILERLDAYYLKFKKENCSYIKKWPSGNNLVGWHVILKQQGYQSPHIHPGGWLSAVIYLKVVPDCGKNEGAIEFSLNGKHYSHPKSPTILHQPQVGDMIFFPSSLHHRTIPFTTNTERIIISFDLLPRTSVI